MATATGLTAEQAQAIACRDVSVALSAGAGCGKTFVLTERFLAQLDPVQRPTPNKLGDLLAITFTDRAAREMRDRIRMACQRRLRSADPAQAAYWRELIHQLEAARISTIHSFCATLLRTHPVEAGLDPNFTLLNQAQANALLNTAIDDGLRSRLAALDESVIQLVARFDLERLQSMLASLLRQASLDQLQTLQAVSPAELVARWGQYHEQVVLPAILAQVADSPHARILRDFAEGPAIVDARMRPRQLGLAEAFAAIDGADDLPAQFERLQEHARVQHAKKEAFVDGQYDQIKDAATKLRDEAAAWAKAAAVDPAAQLATAEVLQSVVRLACAMGQQYADRKADLAALDFQDLLVRAHQLLVAPQYRAMQSRLARSIKHLLVDEFQDTDPLQVDLVSALCDRQVADGKLFFVGDYKQSIYRFRGADPQVFRQLRDQMPDAGRLILTRNFRSQPAILDFVNALFVEPFGHEYQPLRAHREQVSPLPAIEFIWAPEETQENAGERRRREARWVAMRLREMLQERTPLVYSAGSDDEPAQARPLEAGDIAILFRALSDVEYYEQALRDQGLDYYLVGGHAFYSQQEVYDLLNLLSALDRPADEISLVGALRAPWFALSDETIFWLGQHRDGLAAGLFADELPATLDQSQRERASYAAATIRALRAQKDRISIADLVLDALNRTGYDALLLGEFLGQRKLANLHKLIDDARSFERDGDLSLSGFITHLRDSVSRQPDEALAATQSENANVIRLMTIHQAKGLEFPLVVIPDLERRIPSRTADAAYDERLGLVAHACDFDGTPLAGSPAAAHAIVEAAADAAERVRLLYVACTRAADYLILSSGVGSVGQVTTDWTKLLAARFDLATGAMLGTLPAGYIRPQIRVTITAPTAVGRDVARERRRPLESLLSDWRSAAGARGASNPRLVGAIAPDVSSERRFSFSQLTGDLEIAAADAPADSFADSLSDNDTFDAIRTVSASDVTLDARALGTLVHAVLADLDSPHASISALVDRHAQWVPTTTGADRREVTRLAEGFVASPRARHLAAASQLHRELDFLLAWPPGTQTEGAIYFEGRIDCLYATDGGWRIVDYKTNRVTKARAARAAESYRLQLALYALAAEQALGESPVELVVHFLMPSVEQVWNWNDDERSRSIEAISSLVALHRSREAGGRTASRRRRSIIKTSPS